MGSGRKLSTDPDLFSTTSASRQARSSSLKSRLSALSNAEPPPRHILPRDLPRAIKYLNDRELKRLIEAALAERQRRGGKTVVESSEHARKQAAEAVGSQLTTGKLNAVRAAFRAGVKPTLIARQFGLSDADVRGALAAYGSNGKQKRD